MLDKEKTIKAARVALARPTTFWKEVEQRMNARDKAKQIKPRPVVKN